ncbi:MAG: glycerol-3-phosphate 1-O-acyltransferase PlsY [Firmicutes bacterium]|nr:glycerol-3-phosphate 1-O-acyltransferase PlsY [Bacillota bacterium]
MERIICLIIGYCFGCIQSSYIFGKLIAHIDIRDYGSGNAGFTNSTRVLGKKVGALVFICDLLKLIIAYCICAAVFKGSGSFFPKGENFLPGIYAGLGVVLGHNFPFYLKFKGGKGIACTLGLMLCLDWRIALMSFVIGFVVFWIKKYISLSSLVMATVFPVFMLIFEPKGQYGAESIIIMFALCALAFYKHKANIERLLSGTESKFGSRVSIEKKEEKADTNSVSTGKGDEQ